MGSVRNAIIFELAPLMNGGKLDMSLENLQSPEFYEFYQKSLKEFAELWNSQGEKRYGASPSSNGPEAIIEIQKK